MLVHLTLVSDGFAVSGGHEIGFQAGADHPYHPAAGTAHHLPQPRPGSTQELTGVQDQYHRLLARQGLQTVGECRHQPVDLVDQCPVGGGVDLSGPVLLEARGDLRPPVPATVLVASVIADGTPAALAISPPALTIAAICVKVRGL
ncbi:hypothetical protein ACFSTC_27055 [Nonomuraea ferruginea]